ncbi:MAG: MotA/TolQ/ExbB proton channel family protein [Planctomycetaceae bacterium]
MARQAGEAERENRRAGYLITVLDWPVLWGLAATFGFFRALPYLPDGHRQFATRYFAGHWIEYVETGLFFIGMALLTKKVRVLFREREAVSRIERAGAEVSQRGAALPHMLHDALPGGLRRTAVAERLRDAVDHLAAPRSSGSLGDALQHLADLADDRLHGSYALHRNICWAIPILGFLGTVIGITLAIAEIDPEQLSGSLNEVTGGLAVAFDTTALALGLSLVLVFTGFAIERAESAVLERVETFGRKRLAPLGNAVAASPLVQAETRAATELVERTDALIRTQTEAWQGAIESMRRRWSDTLIEQQGQLTETLALGMEMTLTDHAAGLKAAREELVSAVSACTDRLDRTLTQTSRERARQLEAFSSDLRGLWDRCRGDLDDMQDRYQQTLTEAVSAVGSDLRTWREELRVTGETAREHRVEMNRQSELLLRVTEQSAELSRLETRLSDNLESLHSTETLQEAVHSLTAATHLLTARATPWNRAA